MYDHAHYRAIRADVLESLDMYAQHRIPTGGFLEAVLSNDLTGAAGRADMENRQSLVEICGYIRWELPSECHGSRAAVDRWLRNDG